MFRKDDLCGTEVDGDDHLREHICSKDTHHACEEPGTEQALPEPRGCDRRAAQRKHPESTKASVLGCELT